MDFVEEKTPAGFVIKIMFNKWQYLAFTKKGSSVYVDKDGSNLVHHVPLFFLVGPLFYLKKDYSRDYYMLKIRDGEMILPYHVAATREKRYLFLDTEKELDVMPVRLLHVRDLPTMVKEVDINLRPDFVIVDESISENDIIIIKSRYKVENIIHVQTEVRSLPIPSHGDDDDRIVNLNMMSTNPVFLARIHLKGLDLSKVNQLLLDFELTALDTEYILNFIDQLLEDTSNDKLKKHRGTLQDLRDAFHFYLNLLQRNDEKIREIIMAQSDLKKLAPFRTLISKVKSIYPNREEQILYTEYENIVMDRREELQKPQSETPPQNTGAPVRAETKKSSNK